MHGGKEACEPLQRKVVSKSATMRFAFAVRFGREKFFLLCMRAPIQLLQIAI